MDRLIGLLVILLAFALALPAVTAAAQSAIPALVLAIVGLVAIRSVP